MDYNVDQKVEGFVKAIAEQQKSYRHNQVMLTMGEDFQWESAREWYKNLDKLMKYTMEKVHCSACMHGVATLHVCLLSIMQSGLVEPSLYIRSGYYNQPP